MCQLSPIWNFLEPNFKIVKNLYKNLDLCLAAKQDIKLQFMERILALEVANDVFP